MLDLLAFLGQKLDGSDGAVDRQRDALEAVVRLGHQGGALLRFRADRFRHLLGALGVFLDLLHAGGDLVHGRDRTFHELGQLPQVLGNLLDG